MIYSYIDTLLDIWVKWSEGFLSEKLTGKHDINSILGADGSNNPTRANELFKIGLLKFPLTGSESKNAFDLLESDNPVHSNLGYLTYVIRKALSLKNDNYKIQKAFIALKTIFFIQQYERFESQKLNISLNFIFFKLLDLFPIPKDVDDKSYLRYLSSGMFCELNTNKESFLKNLISDNPISLKLIEKKTKYVRATFNNSNDILKTIKSRISLTDIYYEKGSTFLIGNYNSDKPRGLLYSSYKSFKNFLHDAYVLEYKNITKHLLDNLFEENKKDVLIELNKIFSNNKNFKILMKTLQEGSIEALKVLDWSLKEYEPISDDDNDNYNIIYFGPPGTGKSYNADILTKSHPTEKVTFHPEYDYNAFVGGYKPVTDKDGKINYKFTPQIFTNIYVKAWNNPDKTHFLQIEEINRGNVAAIFGDLFQLLDRDENGYSKYSISAEEELKKYLEEELKGEGKRGIKNGKLQLPKNLRIVATMNTSDQSLFPIDSAFKRRWNWKFVPIDYSHPESNFTIQLNNKKQYRWLEFIYAVNTKIYEITQSPDKQIGNFFVIATTTKNIINEETFLNKVLFYLWNDVFKDENETIFLDEEGDKIYFEKFFEYNETERSEVISILIENLGIKPIPHEKDQE